MYPRWFALVIFIIALTGFALAAHATDNEAQAKAAEQVGKYREALNLYVAALQSAPEGSALNYQLREKIIAVASKVKPAPSVHEDARRFLARGRAAAKGATTPKDFDDARAEFAKAAKIAPWLAEAYYNLGIVDDKAGRYAEAASNLKLYLLAAPAALDTAQVKEMLFEIEYRQEKATKQEEAKRAAKMATESMLSTYLGEWNYSVSRAYLRSWGTVNFSRNGNIIEAHRSAKGFQVQGNPAERLDGAPLLLLRGTLAESDTGNIRWEQFRSAGIPECKNLEGFVPTNVILSADQRRISLSLRSLSGEGYPTVCREDGESMTLTRP